MIEFGHYQTVLLHMIEHRDVVYWPNLTTVFYSDKISSQSDIDAIKLQLAEMLIHQATMLQKHRTYQICSPLANLKVANDKGDSGDR